MQIIKIVQGKEKQLLRHHPWVFSKAFVAEGNLHEGVTRVETSDGRFIAWGLYDPKSHIPLHLVSWRETEVIDDAWWVKTIRAAVLRRSAFFGDKASPTTALRVIFGEADMLVGIAADVYGSMIRVIISSHIAWEKRELIARALSLILSPKLIVITTDSAYSSVESLPRIALFWKDGSFFTPEGKMEAFRFREDGLLYEVVPGMGQKSGFYVDQRENRKIVERYAKGRTVLDAFCYTGAFTLHALRAGARHVDALDSSEDALRQLLYHIHINQDAGFLPQGSREKVETRSVNVFEEMRRIPDNFYDLMILDPPKLAKTRKDAEQASRAYKDLNRLAMEKIRSGGIIATFSCSGAIDRETFRTILAWAAQDSRVEAQILETLSAGCDHPVRLSFPESEYLKGFVLRVLK